MRVEHALGVRIFVEAIATPVATGSAGLMRLGIVARSAVAGALRVAPLLAARAAA